MIVSEELKTKLEQCKNMEEVLTTIVSDCWFDWQQDEALEWVDQHIEHIRCVNEA